MVAQRSLGLTTRGDLVAACAIASVSIAGLFVILRFITRTRMLNILGYDDWCIFVSLIFSIANTTGMVIQAENGLGQHIFLLPPQQLTVFLKAVYITIPLYNVSLTFAKISVLFQYLRIFTTRNVKRICYVQLVIVIVYGLWATLSAIFFCIPIASFWDVNVKGKCLPNGLIWFTNAGINIATDIMIVIIPAPLIKRLQLSARQKIGLYLVFMVGLFICIVSILRLHSLYLATITTDPSWENVGVANWSSVELNTAISCACLPTLRPLIVRFLPSLIPSSHGRASYYPPGSGINANRSGGKSFAASGLRRTTKRKSVPDSASETAIVNSVDDFPLTDIEVSNTHPHKGGLNDLEVRVSIV
ncbi:hypothetical protein COCSADRAFT_135290 [Bipolaris sorokiniana ND90Pr]|uniref:Rhodopsin domain-containing protein n=1 Tax=Cochliobolus sativus (strain ND90Pr / ATCC 201652) TaxID=665912 RepID=M2SI33_COCSN|nr:uncharacterized protein COCSADRAFT_135290 [Bipolaris sorokiniana ND90Pr]EMD66873.1 hypothetical protein COCSADRAFT_135290 [Bipolaris sorokiniana ND90Pr]